MRAPSLLLRCCFIIPLIQLVMLSWLYHVIDAGYGGSAYALIPAGVWHSVPYIDFVVPALFQLGPLVIPPLAAWVAFRFPTRLVSLVGLWISLALTFMACLFFSWDLQAPPFFSSMPPGLSLLADLSPAGLIAGLITLLLPLSFGLSSILYLALAIRLPLQQRSALRMSQALALAVMGTESSERSGLAAEERPRAQARLGLRLTIAASLGLLCHLVIALSLFFPYVDYYYPYEVFQPTLTGWQLLAEPFQPAASRIAPQTPLLSVPQAMVLLVTLILPALIYLVCLAPWPLKGERRAKGLRISVSSGYVLNLIGLSLSSWLVVYSLLMQERDNNDPLHTTYLAFAVPPIAFLFSLVCSYVLVTHLRPRAGPGVSGGELQRATMPSHVSRERKYLIVAFVALLGLITLSRFPFPDDGVLGPSGGGIAIDWHLSRGEEFRFGAYVENISDKTLVLHPLTFPLGLAPSLQLRHEVVGSMIPLKDATHVTTIGPFPVEGYHLAPHTAVGITLTGVATAQGTYTIGPATAHADVPFLFTTVQVSRTYTNYVLLCVEVDQEVCRKALQALSG